MPPMMYRSELLRAVKQRGERAVHTFLKRQPRPLCVAFARGWNRILPLSEFCFGRDFRADFLIISAHSGAWHACFVELESPVARLYLRDGSESKVLKVALRQVKDWDIWLRQNGPQFRRELRDNLERAAEVDPKIDANPTNFSADRLLDPRTVIFNHFAVVIGRRDTLRAEDQVRRAHEGAAEIVTYDRLLDIAARDAVGECEIRKARRAYALKPRLKGT
jgi:hypothetical protein